MRAFVNLNNKLANGTAMQSGRGLSIIMQSTLSRGCDNDICLDTYAYIHVCTYTYRGYYHDFLLHINSSVGSAPLRTLNKRPTEKAVLFWIFMVFGICCLFFLNWNLR